MIEIQLKRGKFYPGKVQAWLGDELLCEHRTPICEAARVLSARGMANAVIGVRSISGTMSFPATPVAWWAEKTVVENTKHGPRFGKFTPFPGREGA